MWNWSKIIDYNGNIIISTVHALTKNDCSFRSNTVVLLQYNWRFAVKTIQKIWHVKTHLPCWSWSHWKHYQHELHDSSTGKSWEINMWAANKLITEWRHALFSVSYLCCCDFIWTGFSRRLALEERYSSASHPNMSLKIHV